MVGLRQWGHLRGGAKARAGRWAIEDEQAASFDKEIIILLGSVRFCLSWPHHLICIEQTACRAKSPMVIMDSEWYFSLSWSLVIISGARALCLFARHPRRRPRPF